MNLIPRSRTSDLDSLFDDFFTGFPMMIGKSDLARSLGGIRVDIHENDGRFEVVADLPGVKKKDIAVTLEGDVLSITASKESESEEKKRGKVIRRERSSGTYTRSFSVGPGIKQDDIEANFKDGVLTLIVPKVSKAKSKSDARKITID